MSVFGNLNTDFYQTSYKIDDQSQQSYDCGGSREPQQTVFWLRLLVARPICPSRHDTATLAIQWAYFPVNSGIYYHYTSVILWKQLYEWANFIKRIRYQFWPHLAKNSNSVVNTSKIVDGSIMNETDLARKMVFCLASGATLLLADKIWFGNVYKQDHCNWIARNVLFIELQVFSFGCVASMSLDIVLPWSYFPALHWYFLGRMVQKSFSLLDKIFMSVLTKERKQLLEAYSCALLYKVFTLISIFWTEFIWNVDIIGPNV